MAARNGHEEVTRLLLENSAVDVNSKDNEGRSALSWAKSKGHEKVVKILLENSATDDY